MAFPHFLDSLSKVIAGDAAEQRNLGLQPITVKIPKINITPTEIELEHNVLSQVATAAEAVGNSILMDAATTGLALLSAISKATFKKPLEALTQDPEDYAQVIQGILLDTDRTAVPLEKKLREEALDDTAIEISDDDTELFPQASVSVASAAVSKGDVAGSSGLDVSVSGASVVKTLVVSTGVPDTDVGDGSASKVRAESSAGVADSAVSGGSDKGGEDVSVPAAVVKTLVVSTVVRNTDVGDDGTSGTKVCVKSLSVVADSGVSGGSGGKSSSAVMESDKGGEDVSVPAAVVKTLVVSTAVQDTDVTKAATASCEAVETSGTESVFVEYQGKSHNKRRQCPFCSFGGIHMARHLATTHPDEAESATEQARLVYKIDEKERQRKGQNSTLSNPDERLYQCGLRNCCAIVSRMSQHLRRAHKI